MWGERDEVAGNGRKRSEIFCVQREGAQEVGMPQEGQKEQRDGSGTPTSSVGKGEVALLRKSVASTRSNHKHGGVDNKARSGNLCGVPRV